MTPSISPPSADARARQDSVEQVLYEIKRVIAGQDKLIWPTGIC